MFCGQAVEEYVTASASRSDLDRTSVGKGKKKTGTDTGAVAVHPLSGEKVCGATILLYVRKDVLQAFMPS